MRHVGGRTLNNPVTRASQSGDGGLRIEPGGRSAMTASLFSVMRWHGSVGHTSKHRRTVGFDHGKAVLCSNIHHRAFI